MLVGAGAVRRCEESYVGFEQDLGLAPAYRRAAEEGTIEVAESCCATILAQLRAAEMGVPFLPVRGVRGSDIMSLHPEYAEITCPFTGETLTAVAALRPDVAVIHAQRADRAGNVQLWGITGVQKEAVLSARRAVVTVEEIVPELRPQPGAIVLPGWAVDYVAEVPGGAHPSYTAGYSQRDNDYYVAWDAISRERDSFRRWLETDVFALAGTARVSEGDSGS